MIRELAKGLEWDLLNIFELLREETNIIIWQVAIVQSKATMNKFERLLALELGINSYFGSTGNEEFYAWIVFIERMGDGFEDGYL